MYCRKCGKELDYAAVECPECGVRTLRETRQPRNESNDKALGYIVPINVSGLSIAAGYMGLFSILPVFAPLAVLLGVLALNDLKKNPGRGGKGRAIFGIIMGSIFTVVLFFLVITWRS